MSNENSNKLLEVKDLRVVYTSGDEIIHAVNGVSFSLRKGDTLGLVGETGAGKTTIAKSIIGILPDPPAKVEGGEIWLDGQNLFTLAEKERRQIRGKKESMIFQDPMTALNPVFTVGEQIQEVVELHEKMSKKEAFLKACEMLELVGIPAERYSEYPHQFSGGMKQRVIIAMALACSPELLLADEPTTALDVTIQAQILEMINDLKKKQQTSMILITHDLGIVAETCDEVAIVYAGEIIEIGNKFEIFDYPTHPYTKGLFGAIPKINEDVDKLTAIPGMPPNPADLPKGCHFHPRCHYATDACRQGEIPVTEVRPGHFCKCINYGKAAE